MKKLYGNNVALIGVLIAGCIFFCGCSKEVPINERPMYGNVPPTPDVQKANEQFLKETDQLGSREYGAEQMVRLALDFYHNGDFAMAMKRYNQAWLLNPNNADIYFGFARIAEKKNNRDEAIDMYARAINFNPNYALAYSNRGLAYFNKGNEKRDIGYIEKAIVDFNKAIEVNPSDAQNYNDRAVCYAVKEDYNKSWDDVNKAQELGYKVRPEFLEKLKRVSGREK